MIVWLLRGMVFPSTVMDMGVTDDANVFEGEETVWMMNPARMARGIQREIVKYLERIAEMVRLLHPKKKEPNCIARERSVRGEESPSCERGFDFAQRLFQFPFSIEDL